MLLQLGIGFLCAILISYGAYRAGSLSNSGAWGALVEGTIIFGLGGWRWAIILLTFFISSSVLTRLFGRSKSSLEDKFEKGGKRDLWQVLANGAVASIFAGLHFFLPQANWTWPAFASTLAAVNADTWATELGVLNPSTPRLISNFKPVERGTSGGISVYGLLASIAGAGLVALMGVLLRPEGIAWRLLPAILGAGVLGALFDSLLGATVQAIYHCPHCNKETEKHPLHSCGTRTQLVRGAAWLNNDMVNLGCALMGAGAGILFLL
jgi:uncharacterized protein (TIGR00297 family)